VPSKRPKYKRHARSCTIIGAGLAGLAAAHYLAGEHIADWQGFMEGAVATGYAAAADLLGSHNHVR
jgi:monoamine oxidase